MEDNEFTKKHQRNIHKQMTQMNQIYEQVQEGMQKNMDDVQEFVRNLQDTESSSVDSLPRP